MAEKFTDREKDIACSTLERLIDNVKELRAYRQSVTPGQLWGMEISLRVLLLNIQEAPQDLRSIKVA